MCVFAQQTPPKPFVATAQFGKPYVVGEDPDDYGQIKVDYGKKFEITLESVETALSFPNQRENVLAGANQKLVIFRGSARNLSKEKAAELSDFGVRVWAGQNFRGPGEFRTVLGYDPQTLNLLSAKIPPGQSAGFIQVIQVPATYTEMRLGLYFRTTKRIAWYDLREPGKLKSVFASPQDGGLTAVQLAKVPAGLAFDFDGLEIQITGTERRGAGHTVGLRVTNRMLLPSRWGWQYFNAELVDGAGTAVRFYPEVIDRKTGKPWTGDLAAGASMDAQYSFTPPPGFAPSTLRMTSAANGRAVEAQLTR
jgi:hypothetical protein